jgi:hypothetical protein
MVEPETSAAHRDARKRGESPSGPATRRELGVDVDAGDGRRAT